MSVSPLISAAQAILTSLIPLATEQINAAVFDFHDDLTSLHGRLTMIQSLLCDAENNRSVTSGVMKLWLKNLKLAACHAENLIDEVAYESLRNEVEVRKREKVRNLCSLSNPLAFRPKIANKIKSVNSLLDKVCREGNDMGLRPLAQILNASAIVEPNEWRLTHPFVDDSKIVGREEDVSLVKRMLIGSDVGEDLSVVTIVGMGGLGKSTLAQLVYKDDEVVENFDWRMWICVSDDFRDKRLLNEMVQSLTREKSDIPNVETIVEKLRELLNGKKYLLALDDVWNTSREKWESMRTCLVEIGGSKGSKIIVTTRSMDVVLSMQASPSLTHRLSGLSPDDCWAMFRKRAFANGGPREIPTLVSIGKRMVEKCKGVPLAINSLGGLLYSKHYENEWESIETSKMWGTLGNENGVLSILRLSFDHLPSPCLKQCFMYCSVFPKDQTIIKDELIQLWMALGYLQPSSGSNLEMEDVGNEYFNILSHNSLFQEVKLDPLNNVETCKMHDLVHDLALELSDGNCLTLNHGELRLHPEVQHLSLRIGRERRIRLPKQNIGRLRTLFLSGHFPRNTKGIKCVRALRCRKVPKTPLRKFIHLRYLHFHFSNIQIGKLPGVITHLYNLQTLRLSPSATLEEIPKDFHKLVSLRHFCIADTAENREVMPKMLGHLTSLQTLPFFVVTRDRGNKIEELGSLTKLRGRLHVYGLQFVRDKKEAEQARMLQKSGITELGFHWDGDFGNSDATNHEEVLEGLKPHINLRGLMLENFGGQRLASWMRSRESWLLQNLVKIELRNCRLCEQVSLGYLPHLEVVEMDGLDSLKRIGPEFYGLAEGVCCSSSSCSSGAGVGVFPALRILTLSNMLGLEEWSDLSSSPSATTSTNELFPCLEKLCIRNCPQLIRIIPLGHIPCLEIVEMDGLDNLTHIGPDNHVLDKGFVLDMSSSSGAGGVVVFPALRNLTLSNMSKLEAWSEVSSLPFAATDMKFFPDLENLYAKNCPQLLSILSRLLSFLYPSCLLVHSSYGNFEMRYTPYMTSIVVDPDFKSIAFFLEDFLEKSSKSLRELKIKGLNELCYFPNQLLNLASLSRLEICDCSNLKSLPNPNVSSLPVATTSTKQFFPCLEWFHIWNCPQLTTIPEYIGCLLSFRDASLLSVDSSYGNFEMRYTPYMTSIVVDPDFKSIAFFLEDFLEKSSKSLRELKIKGLNDLCYFPNQLLNLASLSRLEICSCSNLKSLPNPNVSSLPVATMSTKQFFPCLERLHIWNCPQLTTIPGYLLVVRSLAILSVDASYWDFEMKYGLSFTTIGVDPGSKNIAMFLDDLLEKSSKSLRNLEVKGLNELHYFPNQLLNLSSLERFEICECPNLMYITEETEAGIFNSLTSLRELWILRCCKLRCLPKGMIKPTLVSLGIALCPYLDVPDPDEFCGLTTLQILMVGGCPKWVRLWEEGFLCLTSLKMLKIGKFAEELEYFPWPTKSFEILESLSLLGWPKCKYLPDQFQGFNALRELDIYSFDGLEVLPEGLGNFSSLQSLTLRCCKNLTRLPSLEAIQRLTNLQSLSIESCPLLWERCLKGKGEEWHKIAHLQYIKFKKW